MIMKIAFVYKNFAASRNISHIGLGVAALNTSKVLARAGVEARVWPVVQPAEVRARLTAEPDVTHVVISAPWIASADLLGLAQSAPKVTFAVNCHSNVGFLQADPGGVRLFGEGMEVERGSPNFHMAGNSRRFTDWVEETFAGPCAYLPNLYYLDEHVPQNRPPFRGGLLRVGAFGATRPLKNLMSAAGAALTISRDLDSDLELWVNTGREEGGASILRAIREMYGVTRHARVVEAGWASWPNHRKNVARMDLLISCSYTESFNMITADGVAEGVASVVSGAIDWAPVHWQAPVDDVLAIARAGRYLLTDPNTGRDGYRALARHNALGLMAWLEYLGGSGERPAYS